MQKRTTQSATPSTALVLCGGGSGGAVEAGLYRALVELGIHIDFVVGSSIGSVNGALVAAGLSPEEIADHWRTLRTRDVVGSPWQFLRVLAGAPSVFANDRLRRLLRGRLPVHSFDELQMPLVIVATDLERWNCRADGRRPRGGHPSEHRTTGPFPPALWRGRRLVDGGLSNNVPIDVAVERGAMRVIAMRCGCASGLPERASLVSVLANVSPLRSMLACAATCVSMSSVRNCISLIHARPRAMLCSISIVPGP